MRPRGSPSMRADHWLFAGLWTCWRESETTNDLFTFVTTESKAEVKAIRPNAMAVILTTQAALNARLPAEGDAALTRYSDRRQTVR
jgi:putative SOS response-associated peptidase YedK